MVLEKYINKAVKKGNLCFFNRLDTLEIVNRCQSLGIKILGIDEFNITEESTIPLQDFSLDMTAIQMQRIVEKSNCWEIARNFLANAGPNVYFEIVLDE